MYLQAFINTKILVSQAICSLNSWSPNQTTFIFTLVGAISYFTPCSSHFLGKVSFPLMNEVLLTTNTTKYKVLVLSFLLAQKNCYLSSFFFLTARNIIPDCTGNNRCYKQEEILSHVSQKEQVCPQEKKKSCFHAITFLNENK